MANYSRGAGDKVKEAMHEMKEGKLKSGRSGKKVTSRKQAIAIGLSEARERGAKVPAKKSAAKKAAPKKAAGRKTASKTTTKSTGGRKTASKSTARKTAAKSTGRSKTAAKKTGRKTAAKRGTKAAPRKRTSKA